MLGNPFQFLIGRVKSLTKGLKMQKKLKSFNSLQVESKEDVNKKEKFFKDQFQFLIGRVKRKLGL